MSLKAFHLIFVNALSALAFGSAIWKFKEYFSGGTAMDLVFAIGAVLAGVVVIFYGRAFLRKMKSVGYL